MDAARAGKIPALPSRARGAAGGVFPPAGGAKTPTPFPQENNMQSFTDRHNTRQHLPPACSPCRPSPRRAPARTRRRPWMEPAPPCRAPAIGECSRPIRLQPDQGSRTVLARRAAHRQVYEACRDRGQRRAQMAAGRQIDCTQARIPAQCAQRKRLRAVQGKDRPFRNCVLQETLPADCSRPAPRFARQDKARKLCAAKSGSQHARPRACWRKPGCRPGCSTAAAPRAAFRSHGARRA
jgi:hypothetical protein